MSTHEKPLLQGPVLEDSDLGFDLFWERNKRLIISGAVAILAAGVGGIGWFAYDTSTKNAAQNLLANANGVEELREVVAKYPRSMPAADALMLIAASQREAGDMEKSNAAFREFLERFPSHPLVGGALFGIAQNQEASGDIEGAMTTCRQVITQYPQSYAAPFAAYAEAEMLLRDFRRDEARRSLNMVTTQFPSSPVARMAANRLMQIGNAAEASK